MKIRLSLLFICFLLSSCKPRVDVLPKVDEVRAETILSKEEIDQKCIDDGGKLEEWKDDDGETNVFCVFSEGWGCDPELYAYGKCGKGY